MIAAIIIAIIVALIVFFLICRVKISLTYSEDIAIYAKYLFFKFPLYPRKKKKVKLRRYKTRVYRRRLIKKRRKKAKIAEKDIVKVKTVKKKKGGVRQKLQLFIYLLRKVLSKFLGKLRVDVKHIDICVATEDAAKTALLYSAIYNGTDIILSVIDKNTNLHKANSEYVQVYPDFTKNKTQVKINLVFSLRMLSLLDIGLKLAYNYLKKKTFGNINENGGQDNGKQSQ